MGTFFVSKRTVIAVFMLAALVLRSLVPGGFMIAPAAAGDGNQAQEQRAEPAATQPGKTVNPLQLTPSLA